VFGINPYVLLAVVLFYTGSIGAVGFKAYDLGQDNLLAEQALKKDTERTTREITLQATAEMIAKLRPEHQTINRKVETIVREKLVYRDCVSDPGVERMLDDARAGRTAVRPSGDRVLP
jgi:hypothetical protein